jgi:DNA replication protein DnaC
MNTETRTVGERIAELCIQFKLPTLAALLVPRLLEAGHEDPLPLLCELFEAEAGDRRERRIERLRRASNLPPGKTLATLDEKRLPASLRHKITDLTSGDFLERADNVLAFGRPGAGKSHVAAAIGHVLVEHGRSVLFTPTYRLVQELLAAKRDLDLPRALRRLDGFDLLILDDIGYVQQSQEEMEVLFTLLSERYERRSVLITTNLVFSEWDRIFKNPMTTAAAIDRVVHHSVILEFPCPSKRAEDAKARHDQQAPPASPDADGLAASMAQRAEARRPARPGKPMPQQEGEPS